MSDGAAGTNEREREKGEERRGRTIGDQRRIEERMGKRYARVAIKRALPLLPSLFRPLHDRRTHVFRTSRVQSAFVGEGGRIAFLNRVMLVVVLLVGSATNPGKRAVLRQAGRQAGSF